jgi:hypothetical protein
MMVIKGELAPMTRTTWTRFRLSDPRSKDCDDEEASTQNAVISNVEPTRSRSSRGIGQTKQTEQRMLAMVAKCWPVSERGSHPRIRDEKDRDAYSAQNASQQKQ